MVFVAESMRRQATNLCWDWGSNISDKCLIRRMSWESLINAILRCFDIWICVASPDTINQILPLFWFLLIRRKCGLRGDYATDDFIFIFVGGEHDGWPGMWYFQYHPREIKPSTPLQVSPPNVLARCIACIALTLPDTLTS